MSEDSIAVTDALPQADEPTAGMLLRKAREATGLHIAALAVAMKVPVKKLEALEADRLGTMADAVFVRALAASMCRALKIDPVPVLGKLPQSAAPKFDRDDRGINMPYSTAGFQYSHSLKALMAKPTVLLVLGLLVAALAVMLVPEARNSVHGGEVVVGASTKGPTGAAASIAQTDAPNVQAQAVAMPLPVAVVAVAAAPALGASAAVQAPMAAPVPMASAPVVAPHPGIAVADVVVFKAKSSAWIRVTDAKGVIQLEKTLAAGESGSASGLLPLSVVVGNAAATDVAVRGQPFGLETFVKDNVARFEVK